MEHDPTVRSPLAQALAEGILVLDGAMGTMVQRAELGAEDFGGPAYEGCNEHLVLTRPDVIQGIHEAYLEAGADVVETDTFGATPLVLAEYDLAHKCQEINRRAVELAREAADAHTTPEKPRFVLGSVGPTTKTLSVTGGVTFEELVEHYREQMIGLLSAGQDQPLLDGILLETTQDTLNLKAASLGLQAAQEELGRSVPVLISATIEPMGTMLAGQGVEAFWASIEHMDPLSVGLNCATGPEFMADHIRTLSELATCNVTVYPNAGLPDVEGTYDETPRSFARKLDRFLDEGWVNMVGGCCGTTPDHIAALVERVQGHPPRTPADTHRRLVSGIEALEIDPENRPLLVGERTNVIGSKKFKRLIEQEEYELAAEVGRAQVNKGAQVVDVCLADPDRDEARDMEAVLEHLVRKVKVPLMIDSTDADVIELALRHSQGKAIVNSINLEDGEERFRQVCPLLKTYGAAVVVGCIDEDPDQGMAITRERKLAIAQRSYDLLTQEYGIPPRNILFDPLVFPCATGDETYVGSAEETIEGVRLITEAFPECSTILGISNVSFGLPTAGREVLNSVFLYHCVKAGLTFAIVNTEALERYASIPEKERQLAEDLLFNRRDDAIERFANHFRGAKRRTQTDKTELPLEQRLARYIVEGTKDGLKQDLGLALEHYDEPLEIINGPLLDGMDEVGRLFNDNELIVAEVLQSAEAMKAAVAHLEPHMEASDTQTKARILLATVKGDVHDIGKNLVEIILSNNGFDVVNLGIKVPPEDLIRACREHEPDAIGLSGLLVKSAQQMVTTAEDLRAAGVQSPLFVGGAALSDKFTRTRIGPAYGAPTIYAKDAMNGLDLANTLFGSDEAKRQALLTKAGDDGAPARTGGENGGTGEAALEDHEPLPPVEPLPQPTDTDLHVLRNVDPFTLYPYVNPRMLYAKHLGLRGDPDKLVAQGDEKAVELHEIVEALKREAAEKGWIECHGVYRFFPVRAEEDTLIVLDPDDPSRELQRFDFQRQVKAPRRCLTDYVTNPTEADDDAAALDTVALFAVTAGPGVREAAERLKQEGQYLKSHALQALALETAEAFAERLHQRIREHWGLEDDPAWDKWDLFKGRYQGRRYSFGYPACPDLEQQAQLWELIQPDEHIGVELTEGYMMDPEASVSAIVFHHPEATYFDVD